MMRIWGNRAERVRVVIERRLLIGRSRIVHGADVVRDNHAVPLRHDGFHFAADSKKHRGLEFAHVAHLPNLSISCLSSVRDRQTVSVFPSPSSWATKRYGSLM